MMLICKDLTIRFTLSELVDPSNNPNSVIEHLYFSIETCQGSNG